MIVDNLVVGDEIRRVFGVEGHVDHGCVWIRCSYTLHTCNQDWEVWSRPYIQQIVDTVKASHPNTPLTLYANGSGGLLERMAATGVDVVGLDWTIDMADARKRVGGASVQVGLVTTVREQGCGGGTLTIADTSVDYNALTSTRTFFLHRAMSTLSCCLAPRKPSRRRSTTC